MTTELDCYGILQVHPRAEKEVIDAAYRKLAAKYHPDVSPAPDAEERMKQINVAYGVLSDPAKRAAYDAAHGVEPSKDTPRQGAAGWRHLTTMWRTLVIAAGLMLLGAVALRAGPALLAFRKLVVPLAVISLVAWLLFVVAKPRGRRK